MTLFDATKSKLVISNGDMWDSDLMILPCATCRLKTAHEVVKDDSKFTRDYYNAGHLLLVRCVLCGDVVPLIQSTYRDVLKSIVVLLIPLAIASLLYWETKNDWYILGGFCVFMVTPMVYNFVELKLAHRRGLR